jgi:hypothetical protein
VKLNPQLPVIDTEAEAKMRAGSRRGPCRGADDRGRASGQPAPHGVDWEIVVERHPALNWLLGYQGQEWDDVSTDT